MPVIISRLIPEPRAGEPDGRIAPAEHLAYRHHTAL